MFTSPPKHPPKHKNHTHKMGTNLLGCSERPFVYNMVVLFSHCFKIKLRAAFVLIFAKNTIKTSCKYHFVGIQIRCSKLFSRYCYFVAALSTWTQQVTYKGLQAHSNSQTTLTNLVGLVNRKWSSGEPGIHLYLCAYMIFTYLNTSFNELMRTLW